MINKIHILFFSCELFCLFALVDFMVCQLFPVPDRYMANGEHQLSFTFAKGQDDMLKSMNNCLLYSIDNSTGQYRRPQTITTRWLGCSNMLYNAVVPSGSSSFRLDFYFNKTNVCVVDGDVVRLSSLLLDGKPIEDTWLSSGKLDDENAFFVRCCPKVIFNGRWPEILMVNGILYIICIFVFCLGMRREKR